MKKFSKADLFDMEKMIQEYYGDIEISKDIFLKHQYFFNPAGNALIKLAYDFEKCILAGQYVTIPMKVRIWEQEYNAILSLNTLTRESYKGQKIFTTLANTMFTECEDSDIQFCYGVPNPNSHWGFINKLRFNELGNVPLYIRILSPSQLVKHKLHNGVLSQICKPFNFFFHVKEKYDNNYKIIDIQKGNLDMISDFWELIKNKYPIIVSRNKDFIAWRYLDIPLKKYTVQMVLEHEKPVGYAVQRITYINNIKCGMITDFMIIGGKKEAGSFLINHITRTFFENGVELSGCLMQQHFEEAEILKKEGYFICPRFLEPQPFPVILRTFNTEIQKSGVLDFQNWFFTMGDYDAI